MVILTQSTTFIIGPIAKLLGYIMNWLFLGLDAIGIPNIGLAIILFTFITKLLMMPLTVKQMKFTKLSSVMQPELQAIQNKYKGKEGDQNAMLKMNEETKALYAKYGTSPTSGCVQLLIQMPILFALYKVIQNIPAYVPKLKALFTAMLSGESGIMAVSGYQDILKDNFSQFANIDLSNMDSIIDILNVFSTDNWNKLIELFPAQAEVITHNLEEFNHINSFLTINMSQNPGFKLGVTLLIPILAGVTQYISVRMVQSKNPSSNDEDNPAAASMKMMNTVMPIMSAIMAFSLPAGLGLYWSATAVFQIFQQWILNRYFDKKGIDAIVQENVDKANKKRAKKGLPEQKITNNAKVSTKSIASSQEKLEQAKAKKEANDKKIKEILDSTEYYKSSSAKPGSLSAKANMVSKYNEKHNNKK